MAFETADTSGRPIHHTNVLMCIGTEFALLGLDLIADPRRRAQIRARLKESGRTVLPLSATQIGQFAGNAIELQGRDGLVLAMSTRAAACLAPEQHHALSQFARILPLAVPTIESAGGSVRCMLAGVHLAPRRTV